jgi:hypothetical protein
MSSNLNSRFYYASAAVFTPGATPQDIATVSGNDDTIVYVKSMGLSVVQTATGIETWYVSMRSTANTGGVPISVIGVPLDSNYPSSKTSMVVYTTNPTSGTLIGDVWSGYVIGNDASPTEDIAGSSQVVVDFEKLFGQPIALLGTNESIGWNFNGQALPTGIQVSVFFNWYETYKD